MAKKDIIAEIHKILDKKIASAQHSIESAKESRDNETKSSVGDKYETGRAMMQFELEKHQNQLNIATNLKRDLIKIDTQKKFEQVAFGSLVFTNRGTYFISIGLGNLLINNQTLFCISLASPVGKLLFGKRAGDKILWQGTELSIEKIL